MWFKTEEKMNLEKYSFTSGEKVLKSKQRKRSQSAILLELAIKE